MCGCSDKPFDFSAEVIDFSQDGADTVLKLCGCTGVEIKNLGTADAFIDGIIKVEADDSRALCSPNGGHFARNKRITFSNTGTTILEIVYFKHVPVELCNCDKQ